MKLMPAILSIIMRVAVLIAVIGNALSLNARYTSTYHFKRIDVEDGLTQCMVYAVAQDRQGFLWFGTQNGLNRYDGASLKTYNLNKYLHNGLNNNSIFSLSEDSEGKIWIGTENGIVIFDPEFETFRQLKFRAGKKGEVNGVARTMVKDSEGNMWTGISGWGIFKFGGDGGALYFPLAGFMSEREHITSLCLDSRDNVYAVLSGSRVLRIESGKKVTVVADMQRDCPDAVEMNCIKILNDTTILAGTVSRGVVAVNTVSGKWNVPDIARSLPPDAFVRCIETDREGKYWFGTQQGLYVYSPDSGGMTHLEHSLVDPYSLSDNAVHKIFMDREGGMWIGTYFGGVNYYSGSGGGFEKFYPSSVSGSLSGKCISEFCEDSDGRIWVGTEDAGLNIMGNDGKFSRVLINANNIHALMNDNGKIWAGTFSNGLFTIDVRSGKVCAIPHSSTGKKGDDNIYSIFKDSGGTVWVGTRTGLEYYDSIRQALTGYAGFITSQVNDIVENKGGKIWFATIGQGIFIYSKTDDIWRHLGSVSGNNPAAGEKVISLLVGEDDRIWAGTKGAGVVVLDQAGEIVREYSMGNGLPDDVVYKLIKDPDGGIWGSSNNGLFRIDPSSDIVRTYSYSDGLPGDQFNYKSGFIDSECNIYFGGVKGFVRFRHDHLVDAVGVPNLVFGSFKVGNEEISAGGGSGILRRSINYSKEISLPFDKSAFTISFGAVNYASPHRVRYEYRLAGWDKDWIETGDTRHATYSSLPPGKYDFQVRISDVYGMWGAATRQIRIIITPPFYMTGWAYAAYVVISVSLVYIFVARYRRRIRKRESDEISRLQRNYEKEVYDMKINFFTNITHELRTPLSLIKIPVDELLKNTPDSDSNYGNISIIKRNTERLLTLVNQLLDFRKAEAAGMRLNFVSADICGLLRHVAGRFMPSLQLKGIALEINAPSVLNAHVDIEAFTKVISNILWNALKHADTYVSIDMAEGCGDVSISISNDGELIPGNKLSTIFEPFVKVDENSEGSGIGLALVRKLVEAHRGEISVCQDDGVVRFTVTLPLCQQYVMDISQDAGMSDNVENYEINLPSGKNATTVLIVEDNDDMLTLMSNQLRRQFNVIAARNGEEAVACLENSYVDMLVSDVMMPGMNGMELCRYVKGNVRYSHIPVLLLTANTDQGKRMEGLEYGADEYIIKPYSLDFLKARISNLVENRRRIIGMYKNSPDIPIDAIAENEANAAFMSELIRHISENLDNEGLNVDFLAEKMNVSRATLYRKIKGTSDQSPNDFIRLVRLKKAAVLLRDKNLRINEISDMCGFSSPSYFTKCFFRQFGKNPKEYQNDRIIRTDE
ncbi:MAG: response regulator [Muribaculaceae bacterium]|nr:response regulator [Muribaculaceae bacterium]